MEYPKNYCVFDFETTGLDPIQNGILEIGALKVINGETKQFQRIIKVAELPEKITEITGITKEIVDAEGIDYATALKEFLEFIGTLPLVGHNIIRFDLRFLFNALAINNIDINVTSIIDNCIDTASLYKAKKLELKQRWNEKHYDFGKRVMEIIAPGVKYNVGLACDELGIDKNVEQHRAIGDVILTNEIYKKLCGIS